MGFCLEEPELRPIIRQCALDHNADGVPDDFPNTRWVQRFVKRHKSEISFRKPQVLDGKRAEHSTKEVVRGYADRLEKELRGLPPECVWNCDETGVCAQGTTNIRVLCSRGLAANTRRSHDRENVSMMGCTSAAAKWIPPMYIMAGENWKKKWLDGAVDGAACAMTESSNVNGNVFFYWLQYFVARIGPTRPQLLIMDGHHTHLTQRSVGFAIANDIKLFLLPSHTSHFLQPLDVGIFGGFKKAYGVAIAAFPRSKGLGDSALPVRDDGPVLTRVPFLETFEKTKIRGAFFKTGIYPFDVDIMLERMMGSLSSSHKRDLPHHSALETSGIDLHLTERQKKQLKCQGLDLDAFNVVAYHAKTVAIPHEKPQPQGTVITPSMTEGVLLTGQDMVDVLNMNAERKAMALEDKASRRLLKATLREEAEKAKSAKQALAARELKERQSMRNEDKAAHRSRSLEKREEAKRRTAEKRQAPKTEKAALRAAGERQKHEDSSKQRKRRALGDITNQWLV